MFAPFFLCYHVELLYLNNVHTNMLISNVFKFQMFSKNLLGTGLPSPIITATTKHKGKKVHSFKLICYLMLWYDFLIFNIYLQFLLTDVTHVINEW